MAALLLLLIALSCGIATFFENDYGIAAARGLVYESIWFEALLVLSMLNLSLLIIQTKMYKNLAKFLIHFSIIIIFFSSFITRYFGYEGTLYITEKSYVQTSISQKNYLQIWIQGNQKQIHTVIPYEIHPFAPTIEKEFVIDNESLHVKVEKSDFQKDGLQTKGKIVLHVRTQNFYDSFELNSVQNQIGKTILKSIDGLNIEAQYGSMSVALPFRVVLNNFVLKKYPGTNYPSEYLSYVSISDLVDGKRFEKIITMNDPLSYKGYKIFQTSYYGDETGSILSLNKDPGKIPTYIGYALLSLGLFLSFFGKESRFYILVAKTKNYQFALLFLLFILNPYAAHAKSDYIQEYLTQHQEKSKELSDAFGTLVVQAMGRMQPVATLNRDILYKFARTNSLYGMDANQILLGMLSKAQLWRDVPLFQIKTKALKELLQKDKDTKYISFNDLFSANGEYLLVKPLEEAASLKPSHQSAFHKEVIRMNERIEISHMVYGAKVYAIFPNTKEETDVWRDFQALWLDTDEAQSKLIQLQASRFLNAAFNRNYEKALLHVKKISDFQKEFGGNLLIKESKLSFEIVFNKIELFKKLTFISMILGSLALFLAFGRIFYPFFRKLIWNRVISLALFVLFIVHLFGLVGRWYISGHAPMSDTYESMLYISFSSLFFALFFFRKSLFASSASLLLYSMFMLGAHLSHIDPQITTLVPVLKSFWLTLHVSVIAGSYGFLGVGAMIGLLCLILYSMQSFTKNSLSIHINYLSQINEIAIFIGLVLLIIGNLLGAVWANESWGRYWGWDPKETWTFVSIILYTFLTHLRYLKIEDFNYWFNLFSLLNFGAILMTYFGVNYYLAGMHSYAAGDPVPIPLWVYLSILFVGFMMTISFSKRKI